jgi:hypothetical protein
MSATLGKVVKREAPVDFEAKAKALMARALREAADASPKATRATRPSLESQGDAEETRAAALTPPVAVALTPFGRARNLAQRAAFPLSAAAALAMVYHAQIRKQQQVNATSGESLGDIIAEHSRPLPPESSDPKQVRQFERYVGVPVRPPVFAQNARLVGGRVLPVQRERAAMLQYEVERNGQPQRVSVFIYDPKKIHVDGPDLAPRAVGSSEFRVGRSNGYSVAVTQREGVGYVVASDLDPDLSADLIAHAQNN